VSSIAGASELVRDGVDGWVLDPRDPDAIAETLVDAHKMGAGVLRSMGLSAREAVRGWGPERFGQGLMAAAEAGLSRAACRPDPGRLTGRALAGLLLAVSSVADWGG
jgi:glycosyltransferase involved in cell wall biosynthesis